MHPFARNVFFSSFLHFLFSKGYFRGLVVKTWALISVSKPNRARLLPNEAFIFYSSDVGYGKHVTTVNNAFTNTFSFIFHQFPAISRKKNRNSTESSPNVRKEFLIFFLESSLAEVRILFSIAVFSSISSSNSHFLFVCDLQQPSQCMNSHFPIHKK